MNYKEQINPELKHIAAKAKCRVYFPDYHLMPKYPYPAEYDCLHDEGILYGKRLREAGADVTINETRGIVYGG